MAEIVAGVVSTKLAKVIKDLESILSQLDVALSSRASESTVSSINSRLPSSLTASGNLKVAPQEVLKGDWLSAIPNPPNLDVPLSSRASESTLSGIKSQTDKLTFDANNRLAIQNPPNLDVLLSSRASETTLSSILSKLDITLSALRDAITAPSPNSKTLADLYERLDSIRNQLDATLSTRASETTLSGIKAQTDKLTFDANNRLAIQNPPNLDVLLSSRASEATLSAIKAALASVGTDKLRTSVVDALPESPFNITKVAGTALTGRDWSSDLAKLQNIDVLLSTRASETTLSGIKSQTDKLTFDANNRLAIQNPPNLDVALSSLSRLIRFGLDAEPSWIHAGEVTAPTAGSSLVSVSVSAGKTGYIYGFYIMASEPNDFKIQWTSSGSLYSIRITFSGPGTVHYSDFIPLNKGQPADGGSTISVVNVNAGSEGKVYQARLLYLEV